MAAPTTALPPLARQLRYAQRSADHDFAWCAERALVDAVDRIADQPAIAGNDHQILSVGHGIGLAFCQRLGNDHMAAGVFDAKPDGACGLEHDAALSFALRLVWPCRLGKRGDDLLDADF